MLRPVHRLVAAQTPFPATPALAFAVARVPRLVDGNTSHVKIARGHPTDRMVQVHRPKPRCFTQELNIYHVPSTSAVRLSARHIVGPGNHTKSTDFERTAAAPSLPPLTLCSQRPMRILRA